MVDRFTTLISNPPAAPSAPARRDVPDSEPWDQYKQQAAERRRVSREEEQNRKADAVIASMMAGLVMKEGELFRLRAALRHHLYTDVSSESIEMSYAVLS